MVYKELFNKEVRQETIISVRQSLYKKTFQSNKIGPNTIVKYTCIGGGGPKIHGLGTQGPKTIIKYTVLDVERPKP